MTTGAQGLTRVGCAEQVVPNEAEAIWSVEDRAARPGDEGSILDSGTAKSAEARREQEPKIPVLILVLLPRNPPSNSVSHRLTRPGRD
jgi:hypothetical protein